MTDHMHRLTLPQLLTWILRENEGNRIFGIYKKLFFEPLPLDPFQMIRYGKLLETPLGVAAGPHTQLAQNIIASWLCGARYIELKTVQTLDKITVTKPCIEMEDEGYNCEWSQELTLDDSFDEYLNAWIVLHVLNHLWYPEKAEPGFIFNMSVGYNLEGILNPNVQQFLDRMTSCPDLLEEKLKQIRSIYPRISEVNIPTVITDNITISTMHGCPPEEIKSIAEYFITERKLNTAIKLNPTLLGPAHLREILNGVLGYDTVVPDEAFGHDLKYPDAVQLIRGLLKKANESKVHFGLKLTNTLESLNKTRQLPQQEKMVYASGRALHPISIHLARKLQDEFLGELDISFSAGVDALNVTDTLACGLRPVTVCSDLLKPGGYTRLTQYVTNLRNDLNKLECTNLEELVMKTSRTGDYPEAVRNNLKKYSEKTLLSGNYHKGRRHHRNIKTNRQLTPFDCVKAPCMQSCAIDQNIPEYLYHTAAGDFKAAINVIADGNPLANITGNVCDHLCQTKCTRMNIDTPIEIRAVKRFLAENSVPDPGKKQESISEKVAVIGGGPSGLSCGYFLAKNGCKAEIFETKSFAGGMPADSIPKFRLSDGSIETDIDVIKPLGVVFHYDVEVNAEFFQKLLQDYRFVYVAVGARKSKSLGIQGEDLQGVYDQLKFLSSVRRGNVIQLGKRVAVIGGGNSAIDTARTALRLLDEDGVVEVVYRRTEAEMPADREEIEALKKEGITIRELVAPVSIESSDSLLLHCVKMELSDPDESGRRRPVQIKGSDFTLQYNAIITAVGQETDLDFLPSDAQMIKKPGFIPGYPKVYIGGDAVRGADTLINAIADGKHAAKEILNLLSGAPDSGTINAARLEPADYRMRLATKKEGVIIRDNSSSSVRDFEVVHPVLTADEAVNEAGRCLFCDDVCDICTTVCPNLANYSFSVEPMTIPVSRAMERDGVMNFSVFDMVQISQRPQIVNIRDFCNECGNCDSFCPTSGAPYKTKPKLHITRSSFDTEQSGYYFENGVLHHLVSGMMETLELDGNNFIYKSDIADASFSAETLLLIDVMFHHSETDSYEFLTVPEMILLYRHLINHPIMKLSTILLNA